MILGTLGYQLNMHAYQRESASQAINQWLQQFSPERGITTMAPGAPQIFGQLIMHYGIPLTIVLPCHDYLDAFDNSSDLIPLAEGLAKANHVEIMPYETPTQEGLQAAETWIVRHCNGIIAAMDMEHSPAIRHAYQLERPIFPLPFSTMTKKMH